MPTPPRLGEREKDFIDRCIPAVIHDGTTQDPKQAVAICYTMWNDAKKKDEEVKQQIHDVIVNSQRKEDK